jgi:hypothetical protein
MSTIEQGGALRVVIVLHGIRDRATWQRTLAPVLSRQGFTPELLDYGCFIVIPFLLPGRIRKKIDWFRDQYQRIQLTYPGVVPSVIAHSFGSYIVCRGLQVYAPLLRFDNIILCGSIVRRDYAWNEAFTRRLVNRVLNDRGALDTWSRHVQHFVGDAGASGRDGFTEDHERLTESLHHEWKHSDFFFDANFTGRWIPFLNGEALEKPSLAPTSSSPRGLIAVIATFIIGVAVLLASLLPRVSDPRPESSVRPADISKASTPHVVLPVLAPPRMADGEPPFIRLDWHPFAVRTLNYSTDGHWVAACAGEAGATLWKWVSAAAVEKYFVIDGAASCSVFLEADEKVVIAGSGLRELILSTRRTQQLLEPVPRGYISTAAVSEAGSRIAWSDGKELGLLDLEKPAQSWRGSPVLPPSTLPRPRLPPGIPDMLERSRHIITLEFASDDSNVLILATPDMTPVVYSLNTRFLTHIPGFAGRMLSLFRSKESAVTLHYSQGVGSLNLVTVQPFMISTILRRMKPTEHVISAAVSDDGQALAVTLFDSEQEAPESRPTVAKNRILVWDLNTSEVVREWTGESIQTMAWSPLDGNLLVGGRGGLRLYLMAQ